MRDQIRCGEQSANEPVRYAEVKAGDDIANDLFHSKAKPVIHTL
jgi:hypothetical protein